MGRLVTSFGAAGSASDGAQALPAECVSAALTVAGMFLAPALAVTPGTRTVLRPRAARTWGEDCAAT